MGASKKMVNCHECGKKIQRKLFVYKCPFYYFKLVMKHEDDCLFWCGWDCLKKYIKRTKKEKGFAIEPQ